MKYLGIDYGLSYVGLATSDEAGEFAFPYCLIQTKDFHKAIKEILEKEQIVGLVFGGGDSVRERAKKALKEFEGRIPIYEQNENFSSVEAHRYQKDSGRRDDSAAAIILQRFLDKKKK